MDFLKLFTGPQAGENQTVEHQSGASRLMNSICAAVCLAPFLVICMVIVLGWNEKRAVCRAMALDAGLDHVQVIGCNDNPKSGDLVLFSCDIQKDGLVGLSPLPAGNDFANLDHVGVGLATTAEMYQCVEHVSSKTTKDKSGGGGKTTVKTYTYTKEFTSQPIDSSKFNPAGRPNFDATCGGNQNPPFPLALPSSGNVFQSAITVGSYKLEGAVIQQVPLTSSVANSTLAPPGWTLVGESFLSSTDDTPAIGTMRVSFKSNNWNTPGVTVLGTFENGRFGRWTAPSSWGCSGDPLLELKSGTVSKDEFFKELKDENGALTWILRLIGFGVLWCAFSLCLAPLGVAADCIPCVGPFLGDVVEYISCCLACLPASACCMLVVGIVWVAMRPLIGIPLMVISLCIICGMVAYRLRPKDTPPLKDVTDLEANGDDGNGGAGNGHKSTESGGIENGNAGNAPDENIVEERRAPVAKETAHGFIEALRNEYVNSEGGAVGVFFEKLSEEDMQTLTPFEDQVREAPDAKEAIDQLSQQWAL